MATYLVNAPNRSSVSVSCKLGQFTFKHQQLMVDDKLADLFPSFFQKISDEPSTQVVEKFEPVEIIPEELKVEEMTEDESEVIEEIIPEELKVEEMTEDESEVIEITENDKSNFNSQKKRGRKPKSN